jgi:hypothetical protein
MLLKGGAQRSNLQKNFSCKVTVLTKNRTGFSLRTTVSNMCNFSANALQTASENFNRVLEVSEVELDACSRLLFTLTKLFKEFRNFIKLSR